MQSNGGPHGQALARSVSQVRASRTCEGAAMLNAPARRCLSARESTPLRPLALMWHSAVQCRFRESCSNLLFPSLPQLSAICRCGANIVDCQGGIVVHDLCRRQSLRQVIHNNGDCDSRSTYARHSAADNAEPHRYGLEAISDPRLRDVHLRKAATLPSRTSFGGVQSRSA